MFIVRADVTLESTLLFAFSLFIIGVPKFSVNMKSSHAFLKDVGVFFSPTPNTYISEDLNLEASIVKSLSLETSANASYLSVYNRSIASIIIAASVEFLPLV